MKYFGYVFSITWYTEQMDYGESEWRRIMSDAIKKEKSLKVNAVLNVIKQCSTAFFPLITYPYISRVLGSDNFGRISFASSIIEYGMVFAALGIPTYI